MIVQLVFFFVVLLFIFNEYRTASKLSSIQDRKLIYWLLPILLIGVLFRSVYLTYPDGVFVDGAMGGYDAWCLAHYGVDSNLASYPVYLRSWGSGQSALYAYLSIPFIKLFGLSTESYRLPMSLLGCFTILFLYWTLRKTQKNVLLTFCISALVAINPWHIIKCRFGLDCNIFPDLLLIGICLIILAINTTNNPKKNIAFICGFVVISISAYGYGVSWFMLPVLYLLLFIFLIKKKMISTKLAVITLLVSFIVVLPLILFAIQLVSGGEQYQIGNVTITTLTKGRHYSTTLIGTNNFLFTLRAYIGAAFKILIGMDSLPSNQQVMYPFGAVYNVIGLPLAAAGIYTYIRNRKNAGYIHAIFFIWLVSCIFILILVEPNIFHWNAVWFPLMYFSGYGAYLFASKLRANKYLLASVFSMFFICFSYMYITRYPTFFHVETQTKEAVRYVATLDMDRVYYPGYLNHAYIMFYAPISPYEFNTNRTTNDYAIALSKAFSNVIIGLPSEIVPKNKVAYVVPNSELSKINLSGFRVQSDKYYTVLWND